jgi:hypothetical protein
MSVDEILFSAGIATMLIGWVSLAWSNRPKQISDVLFIVTILMFFMAYVSLKG